MKKFQRFILLPLMLLTLLLSVPITAEAVRGNGTRGPSSSSTEVIEEGLSYAKTGFLIYLCDKDGLPVGSYKPKIVWYKERPEFDFECGYDDYVYSNIHAVNGFGDRIYIAPRLTAIGTPDYNNTYEYIDWNMPVFNSDGSGNGIAIKRWLVSPYNGYEAGVLFMIEKYWGQSAHDAFIRSYNSEDPEDCWYFVVEGIAYSGLYYGDEWTGKYVFATMKQMASYSLALGGYTSGMAAPGEDEESAHFKFNRYWYQNFPNALKLEESWCGVPVPSYSDGGKIPMRNLMEEGYCIEMVRPEEALGGYTVVKSLYDNDTLEESFEESCGTNPDMGYEGYEVVAWETNADPNITVFPSSEYDELVNSKRASQRRTGEDEAPDFEFEDDEKVLYVKLVREETGPYKIVKTYIKDNNHVATVTSSTSDTDYTIEATDRYRSENYECKAWFTTSETPSPSPSRTTKWDTIISRYNDSDTLDYSWDDPDVPKPIEFSPDDGEPKNV